MAIEHLSLPAAKDRNGDDTEQWIKRQTDPSGEELRRIERDLNAKAIGTGITLMSQDVEILILVTEWQVVDRDGEVITGKPTPSQVGKLSQRLLNVIGKDLELVLANTKPADAARDVVARMEALKYGLKNEDAAVVTRLVNEWAELMGIGGPNPGSQEA